ncbi:MULTISPECIES: 2-hydroxychromene-2-carboxylate isomerase [Bordetella]|uniref:2-hydroxychromene-2-carboxylate isomerase n=1 Tax=Bordetella genomosp. 6 TaxID=463024 RepID=A0ABX4FB65_9BORD|nr:MULTISPECIES: 2-hydroxychromene-2-carboxylate isomerase [Bordetella]AOB25810.1 2-hydroxychromene-2-carboxylate isomerase [Bordetella bronchiseptica]AZW43076.1 2-hydroxychromene-2-carboxylate isomerase [Bordetella bronchiseptica]KCV64892.1 DSBA-like thioredoxin domain protein [Bordetella bronchiseptica 99-R-0433]MBN3268505.1 2-hydroxychromene-2-carboxylate isomerase [Bordetella bronchiseptica]OZI73059.1 2-hydroxychromene-2-carboxylate isomerase [Bordetella genomosp. 6]
MHIDYYFSVVSDWAYFGGERLERLARRHGATIRHKPMQLSAVYEQTGGILLQQRSTQRQAYRVTELERWRDHLGIPITLHPRHYPVDDIPASCAILAAQELGMATGDYANAVLRAIWAQERDISNPQTLHDIARGLGLDADAILQRARAPHIRERLAGNTREAIGHGVFGSPFYLCNGHLFWGQDRLPFLEDVLAGRTGAHAAAPAAP